MKVFFPRKIVIFVPCESSSRSKGDFWTCFEVTRAINSGVCHCRDIRFFSTEWERDFQLRVWVESWTNRCQWGGGGEDLPPPGQKKLTLQKDIKIEKIIWNVKFQSVCLFHHCETRKILHFKLLNCSLFSFNILLDTNDEIFFSFFHSQISTGSYYLFLATQGTVDRNGSVSFHPSC